ncbi:MAG: pyrroline-5-carboxylate reductase, partial [Gammaproteobacteria bacterium]
MDANIGFIGAGNMANSLIRGLINHGASPERIWAADIDSAKLELLADECGINTGDNTAVAAQCQVLVLAVKPQVMPEVAAKLGEMLSGQQPQPLIVSVAAGITIGLLQRWLGNDLAIIRCMPNTPALIGFGATGLFANDKTGSDQRALAEGITSSVGVSVWVNDEQAIDAVTALSGSGPAYFFLFMEAMQEAALEMGLNAETARTLTYQTALGAAKLAMDSEDSSAELRRKVTSPRG